MAQTTTTARTPRRSPGDMTGKIKEEQRRAALKEDRAKLADETIANAAEAEDERTGIFDPQSGDLVGRLDSSADEIFLADGDEDGEDVEDEDEQPFPADVAPFFNPRGNEEPVLTGKESAEQIAQMMSERKQPKRVSRPTVRNANVKIRTNCDIDDMTYGMYNGEPNNFTFKEGPVYTVSVDVAEHLNDKGLVAQWLG